MPPIDLSPDELETLADYARKKYASERWPLSIELRPVREILDKVFPRRPPAPSPKVYAPPKATPKQRRGFTST
jgi:hypothetical protein